MWLIHLHWQEASRHLILKQSDKVSVVISFSSLQSSYCKEILSSYSMTGCGRAFRLIAERMCWKPGKGSCSTRTRIWWLEPSLTVSATDLSWQLGEIHHLSWPHSKCFRNTVTSFYTDICDLQKSPNQPKQINQNKPRKHVCSAFLFSYRSSIFFTPIKVISFYCWETQLYFYKLLLACKHPHSEVCGRGVCKRVLIKKNKLQKATNTMKHGRNIYFY